MPTGAPESSASCSWKVPNSESVTGRATKGRPGTTKTLVWRPADEAVLRTLRAQDIVYVHVNDAPEGVPVEAQLDLVRRMPGATGVIDIAGFLQALREIGYDGPVTPEPFEKSLNALPADEACKIARDSMRQIWQALEQ